MITNAQLRSLGDLADQAERLVRVTQGVCTTVEHCLDTECPPHLVGAAVIAEFDRALILITETAKTIESMVN